LNIFFVGQYEFNEIIRRPENRAVAQRLTLNYYIEPLTLEETGAYIQHRLRIAGTTERIFHPSAVKAIYDFSEGFPRKINIICDHCLMSGYAEDKRIITNLIVRDSAKELQIPVRRRDIRPERPLPVLQPDTSMSVPPTPPVEPLVQPREQAREQPREQPRQQVNTVSRQPKKAKKRSFFQLMIGVLLIFLVVVSFGFFFLYFTETTYKELFTSLGAMQENIRLRVSQVTGEKQRSEVGGKTLLLDNKKEAVSLPTQNMPAVPAISAVEKDQQTAAVPLPGPEEADIVQEISKADAEDSEALLQGITKITPALTEEMSAPTVNAEPLPEQPVMIAQPGVQPENTLPPLPAEPLVIRFKSDSNEFSGADIEKMKEFAGIVRLHPAAIINVFGYTDSIGDAGYNRKLSEFRANIVKSFLLG